MKLYTALDVSLRSVAICVVNEHGEVQYEAKVEADVQRIVTCLRSFKCAAEGGRLRSWDTDAVSDLWAAGRGL